MSTVNTPSIPHLRIVTILVVAVICALTLTNEYLKISIFLLAIVAGFTIADTEKIIRLHKQQPPGVTPLRSMTFRHLDFFAGTDDEFRQFFAADCSEPERIVHSATRCRNGRIYSVAAPGRHHQILSMMRQVGVPTTDGGLVQGFVTSRGRFLGRSEAAIVARKANQLIRKTAPDYQLFSEDVWDPAVLSHQQLLDKAAELVMNAYASQAVVTIDLKPAFPGRPAMGNYQMVPSVRDSRAECNRKFEEHQRLKAEQEAAQT